MENVFFRPWVGKQYLSGGIFGKRILVLGESHRCRECNNCGDLKITESECRDFTTDTVLAYKKYNKGELLFNSWMNTFTKFGNITQGESLSSLKMIEFWDSVLFYNYVQYAMNEARVAPSEMKFTNSQTAFFEILEEYKPDLIIAWGKRLWQSMPDGGDWGEQEIGKGVFAQKPYYYKTESGKKIPAFWVHHPSHGLFNYGWSPFIKLILEM